MIDHRRTYRHIPALVVILLLAVALRIHLLVDYRFHPDEALFATLGRLIITGDDALLTDTSLLVDKPPLLYYTLAGGIAVSWVDEFAARLPGLWSGLISIALTARLARRLWASERAGLISAIALTLSPYAILFSPTAFADPLMMMWILAAAVAAVEGHYVLSGVWGGLAMATKPTAAFVLPIVLIAVWGNRSIIRRSRSVTLSALFRMLLGVVPVMVTMIAWDFSRGADSFLISGFSFNNPGRLIRSEELLSRLSAWGEWLQYAAGTPLLTLVTLGLAVSTPLLLSGRLRSLARLLTAYLIGYSGILWLVAFPLLDRYLLPVNFVTALMLGGAGAALSDRLQEFRPDLQKLHAAGGLLLLIVLLFPAVMAARGDYPVGGDHGQFDGITEVGTFLRGQPVGTVVYYETLGWTLNYYTFKAYIYLAPFGSPYALRADLEAYGQDGSDRFLVLPGWESRREALFSVHEAGFRSDDVLETRNRSDELSFILYRLTPND